jgi:hypothetical protein
MRAESRPDNDNASLCEIAHIPTQIRITQSDVEVRTTIEELAEQPGGIGTWFIVIVWVKTFCAVFGWVCHVWTSYYIGVGVGARDKD